MDPLTGLPSRQSMMQAMAQAELDRERFAVAILDVRHFARYNRCHGMVVGDELLCVISRALILHTATGTEACRLGGDRFAIMALEPDCPTRWVAPILTAVRAAIEVWTGNRGIRSTVGQPDVMVGVAEGWTAEVFLNAETALRAAKNVGMPVVDYRTIDPTTRRRLGATAEPAARALAETDLLLLEQRIEPVDRPEPAWLWLRFTADPGIEDEAREPIEPEVAHSEMELVERWLVEQACRRLAQADRQMRISVPVSTEAASARSLAQHVFPIIEHHRVPPSRLVFEIAYRTVAAADRRSTGPGRNPTTRFLREISGLGSCVAVTGFGGGWTAWSRLRGLGVAYLRPGVDLMRAAGQGDSIALRLLSSMTASAEVAGLELIAPWTGTEPARTPPLIEAFTYRELPPAHSDPAGDDSRHPGIATPHHLPAKMDQVGQT